MEDAVFHWASMVVACAVAITGYLQCVVQVLFAHESTGMRRAWVLVPPLPLYMRWRQKGRWTPIVTAASILIYIGLWLTQ